MREPPPVLAADLFPPLLDALLALLDSLSADDWARPTACAGWSVKDVACHLLADDMGILSRRRDGYLGGSARLDRWDDLLAFINRQNELWVEATRRLSPRLTRDLLAFTGPQVAQLFAALDPFALGGAVSWAGPEPAPVWLDVAREYTERWLHQQHLRDAVDRPGLTEPRFLAPVLAAFVRALPYTYRNVTAPDDAVISLHITGDAGGRWAIRREAGDWRLYIDPAVPATAEVRLAPDTAWRLFTRGIDPLEARRRAAIDGDATLAEAVFTMVSIIA